MINRDEILLDASQSALLLIDIQEKFRPGTHGMEGVIDCAQILARAALRLGIPVLISEQYPKALGPTVAEIRQWLPDNQAYHGKMTFSSMACEPFRLALRATGRKQVVVAGVETHVCVLQTALGLPEDTQAFVIADAVASRKPSDRDAALRRMERQGVNILTTEMVVFEWLRVAGTPEFKELQALIK